MQGPHRSSVKLILGCPHAKELLEKLKSGAELKEEEKEGCGCGSADRKNAETEKDEEKESELPKPDETYPDKRYNQEILIPKGTFIENAQLTLANHSWQKICQQTD